MNQEKTVLLVDDEKDFVKTTADYLSLQGYQIQTAYDGAEALKKLKQEAYSFLLLDWKMPQLDGMTLLTELQKYPLSFPKDISKTCIIMLTAYGDVASAVEAMKKGADNFIGKPFDLDHLLILMEKERKFKDLLINQANLEKKLKQFEEIKFQLLHKILNQAQQLLWLLDGFLETEDDQSKAKKYLEEIQDLHKQAQFILTESFLIEENHEISDSTKNNYLCLNDLLDITIVNWQENYKKAKIELYFTCEKTRVLVAGNEIHCSFLLDLIFSYFLRWLPQNSKLTINFFLNSENQEKENRISVISKDQKFAQISFRTSTLEKEDIQNLKYSFPLDNLEVLTKYSQITLTFCENIESELTLTITLPIINA